MNLSNALIINTETFLQCHGSCAGCFLTSQERLEDNTYLKVIEAPLLGLLQANTAKSHVIIGFGRGNLLNMTHASRQSLVTLMNKCEAVMDASRITYEVSTSLIGKIDKQIEVALELLNENRRIYFNVVVNSEITSASFWANWEKFYEATSRVRKSWGWQDNWGDILVLNVNPAKLPELDFIERHVANKGSPFNISLFPFSGDKVSNEELSALNEWSQEMWLKFKSRDLNIKNYLTAFNELDATSSLSDVMNYHRHNERSYYFIDKHGQVTPGSLSIMGEVDYPRLVTKFGLVPRIEKSFARMQKMAPCNSCEHQALCIVTGAYINMLSNSSKIDQPQHCPSGYAGVFALSKS